MNLRSLCLFILVSMGCMSVSIASAADADASVFTIQSRWDQRHFLGNGGDAVTVVRDADAARFSLERVGAAYLIKSATGNAYVVVAEGSDELQIANAAPTSDRGRWLVEPVDTFVIVRNKGTRRFLNIEKQATVDAGLDKRPDAKNWWSGLWKLNHVSGPELPKFVRLEETVVTSPAYGATVKGDTPIKFRAPGLLRATVKCWQGGDGFGSDTTIGEVELDADGVGEVVFPADKYPHGPVVVRVLATGEGKAKNNYYLMLYNEGGKKWNAGMPSTTPEPAKGMELLFADDFDKPELSITKDGAGATYMSHKPGGGDFSGVPFGDHENADTTPFSQVDTYLRIRADQSKKTTGLISSLRKDGTGLTFTVPFYAECRFVAQSSPGTWPAFWTMTQGVHKGLREPADELDVIEAYGGEGSGAPNQRGYWIHSHYWNQAPDGKKDYTQDRFGGMIKMHEVPGLSGASWFETFHTYGVLVGREDTVYYCNGVEVARHKTARISKAEPHFFFVNMAIGGASGWKIDLNKYNGVADMYVDYVRVYQGQ